MPFDDGKKTVSGSVAHTDDAATKVPFVSLKCGIAPTLSGVSTIDATVTGKNFIPFAKDYPNFTQTKNDMTISVLANGKVKFNGTTTASTDFTFYSASAQSAPHLFVKNGTYTFSNIGSASVKMVVSGGGNNGFPYREITNSYYTGSVTDETKPFNYIIFRISSGTQLDNVVVEPMLEYGSSASSFEPYTAPTTATVNLGRTIYGGEVDIVNGTGTATWKKIVADGVNVKATGGYASGANRLPTIQVSDAVTTSTDIKADYLTTTSSVIGTEDTIMLGNSGASIVLHIGTMQGNDGTHGYSSDAELLLACNSYLADHNLTIVYKLSDANATDFTFTPITPTPETVGKVNNVYCDTGNTELTYYDNAHGFSEITVNRCRKNLWDEQWEVGGINDATGVPNSDTDKIRSKTFSIMKGGATYYAKAPNNIRVLFYASDYSFLSETNNIMNATFTAPSNCVYFKIRGTVAYGTTYNNDIAINYPSTETAYEEYSRESKTAYLHKVIYGGQADVVRGTAKPKNLAELSNADNPNRSSYEYTTESPELIEWTKTGDGGKFYARFILHIPKPGKYTISCSADSTLKVKYIYSDELWGTTVFHNVSTNPFVAEFSESGDYVLGFYAGSSATSGTLKEVMCEEGETQTSYAPYFAPFSFPPISMETDEGENTLYASEGDSVITYRKETD